jgi:cardiolipin synthase
VKRALQDWRAGNRVDLLENGEVFFPRVFEAIAQARRSVYLETFIFNADSVGQHLRDVLCAAARRGVQVDVLADHFGSPDLHGEFLASLADAGVRVALFEPGARLFGRRFNVFRRLHRKITLVDRRLAFVGGINYCREHLREFGPKALHDYAVELEGPVVADIARFVDISRTTASRWRFLRRPAPPPALAAEQVEPRGAARVKFVTRDNHRRHTAIEHEYRVAFRTARREVIVANAYFFPGYRLLRDLRNAARRGVQVSVIVQGNPDLAFVTVIARWLYHYLVPAGVRVYEFRERPLHAKVAVVDGRWSTVGSSNLDPLSLSLNLEANVLIDDAPFAAELRGRLCALMRDRCRCVTPERVPRRTWWRVLASWGVFHFLRHFPRWAGWLPAHRARIEPVAPVEKFPPHDRHALR